MPREKCFSKKDLSSVEAASLFGDGQVVGEESGQKFVGALSVQNRTDSLSCETRKSSGRKSAQLGGNQIKIRLAQWGGTTESAFKTG